MTTGDLERPEIHVWLTRPAEIEDTALLASYDALLAPEERERGGRYRFERHRHQFLLTRALVRTTLSHYFEVDPAEWRFSANDHGRPEIAGPYRPAGLSFNLSHTDGLIACAVAMGCVVGCDVESLTRRVGSGEIARRFFAPREIRMLERTPEPLIRKRFLELWTLKEAYLKACGTGLRTSLQAFAFELERPPADAVGPADARPIQIHFDGLSDDPAAWHFHLEQPDADHVLSVAARTAQPTPVRTWSCVPGLGPRPASAEGQPR